MFPRAPRDLLVSNTPSPRVSGCCSRQCKHWRVQPARDRPRTDRVSRFGPRGYGPPQVVGHGTPVIHSVTMRRLRELVRRAPEVAVGERGRELERRRCLEEMGCYVLFFGGEM